MFGYVVVVLTLDLAVFRTSLAMLLHCDLAVFYTGLALLWSYWVVILCRFTHVWLGCCSIDL